MSYTTPRRRRILMTRNNLTLFPNISKLCGCYIDVFGTSLSLQVYDLWTLPFFLCDLYIAMDVICSTASIFNLVAISMDRSVTATSYVEFVHENVIAC